MSQQISAFLFRKTSASTKQDFTVLSSHCLGAIFNEMKDRCSQSAAALRLRSVTLSSFYTHLFIHIFYALFITQTVLNVFKQ